MYVRRRALRLCVWCRAVVPVWIHRSHSMTHYCGRHRRFHTPQGWATSHAGGSVAQAARL